MSFSHISIQDLPKEKPIQHIVAHHCIQHLCSKIARREWRGSLITVVVMVIPMGTTIITPHLYAWWSHWAFQFLRKAPGGRMLASMLGQQKGLKCKLLGLWMVPQLWDLTKVVQGLRRSSWMNATGQWMPLVFIDIIWCQKLLTCHRAWRVLCLATFPTSEPPKKESSAASPNLKACIPSGLACWPEMDALSTLCSRMSWVACHMGWRARARGLWPTSSEDLGIMELALQGPLVAVAVVVAAAQPAAAAVAPLRKQAVAVAVAVAQPAAAAAVGQPAVAAVAPPRKQAVAAAQPAAAVVAQPAAAAVAPPRKQAAAAAQPAAAAVAQPAAAAVAPPRKQAVAAAQPAAAAVAQLAAAAVAPLRKQAAAAAVAQPAGVDAAQAMLARARCSARWVWRRRRVLAQWSACRSAICTAIPSPLMRSRTAPLLLPVLMLASAWMVVVLVVPWPNCMSVNAYQNTRLPREFLGPMHFILISFCVLNMIWAELWLQQPEVGHPHLICIFHCATGYPCKIKRLMLGRTSQTINWSSRTAASRMHENSSDRVVPVRCSGSLESDNPTWPCRSYCGLMMANVICINNVFSHFKT